METSFDFEMDSLDYFQIINPQPDGKILFMGGTWGNVFLGRMNENGSLDTSFKNGMDADLLILSLFVLPDGKILVGCQKFLDTVSTKFLIRLNKDGDIDHAFMASTGISKYDIYPLLIQADGKILVVGVRDD